MKAMRFLLALVLANLCLQITAGVPEHVVVLMMENRSFDHLLGWLHELNPEIDGLTGNECNTIDDSTSYCVNKNGYNVSPSDPNHDINSTTEQIYGYLKPYNATAQPNMSGFLQNAYNNGLNYTTVMSMFHLAPTSAPVINTLAMEYAVFDRWYASVPGPTDPNRGFVMSGTSNGMDTNFNGTKWSQQSYFNFLGKRNVTWNGFYQIDPWGLFYFEDSFYPENIVRLHELDNYYRFLKEEKLAKFSFLQPQMNTHRKPPDWQHPDASLQEGERLIKNVYEALRNSTYWEKSVLIITYDEHGGFYDHVTPPQEGIPPPDGVVAPDGFTFNRLGIRIPTVMISPLIPKHTVVHRAKGPTPTSEYDHTSIMATCNKMFGIDENLTARAAWAGTFEHIFSLDTPRTDCPFTLPEIPPWTLQDLHDQWNKPLNDHLQIQVNYYCKLNHPNDKDCGKNISNQYDASIFVEKEVDTLLRSLSIKK